MRVARDRALLTGRKFRRVSFSLIVVSILLKAAQHRQDLPKDESPGRTQRHYTSSVECRMVALVNGRVVLSRHVLRVHNVLHVASRVMVSEPRMYARRPTTLDLSKSTHLDGHAHAMQWSPLRSWDRIESLRTGHD